MANQKKIRIRLKAYDYSLIDRSAQKSLKLLNALVLLLKVRSLCQLKSNVSIFCVLLT